MSVQNITYRGHDIKLDSTGTGFVMREGKVVLQDCTEESAYKWIDSSLRHEREFLARGEYRDGNTIKRELE